MSFKPQNPDSKKYFSRPDLLELFDMSRTGFQYFRSSWPEPFPQHETTVGKARYWDKKEVLAWKKRMKINGHRKAGRKPWVNVKVDQGNADTKRASQ